jgi:hypothetical protein
MISKETAHLQSGWPRIHIARILIENGGTKYTEPKDFRLSVQRLRTQQANVLAYFLHSSSSNRL